MAKIIKSSKAMVGAFVTYECGALGAAGAVGALVDDDEALDGLGAELGLHDDQADQERRLQELYSEGLRRGIEAGRAEFREAVAESTQVLRQAAQAIRESQERFLASTEPGVLRLVREITARILQREATVDPGLVVATVREALRAITERDQLVVLVNPRDLQALRTEGIDPLEGIEGVGHVDFVPDESVGLGGCVVESPTLRVDARLDEQLERIFDKLLG